MCISHWSCSYNWWVLACECIWYNMFQFNVSSTYDEFIVNISIIWSMSSMKRKVKSYWENSYEISVWIWGEILNRCVWFNIVFQMSKVASVLLFQGYSSRIWVILFIGCRNMDMFLKRLSLLVTRDFIKHNCVYCMTTYFRRICPW